MYANELMYFIVFTVIILLSQFLPTQILLLLDNIAVRIGSVLLLLYLINIGPTAGIFGIMAISILYIERNRRKVKEAVKKLDDMDIHAPYASVEEAGKPQTTVPVREFDVPEISISDFLPHETSDPSDFEPVAPTINQKAVLSSIYPLQREDGTAAAPEALFEQMGFGHISDVNTHGEEN